MMRGSLGEVDQRKIRGTRANTKRCCQLSWCKRSMTQVKVAKFAQSERQRPTSREIARMRMNIG